MGRYAGWIALESALLQVVEMLHLIQSSIHDINKAADDKIKQRGAKGKDLVLLLVAEGAAPKDGEISVEGVRDNGKGVDNTKLGGAAGIRVAKELEAT